MTTTRVDPAAVRNLARTAGWTGEDIAVAAGRWRESLADPARGCGLADLTGALEGVRDAWHRDFAVYAEALREWARAAQAAADAYDSADDTAASRL